MSGWGQKRSSRDVRGMSALPPITDIRRIGWYVRYVPIATNAPQQTAYLFDHLVGTLYKFMGDNFALVVRDDHTEPLVLMRLKDFADLAR
jgi:hypothetical protein